LLLPATCTPLKLICMPDDTTPPEFCSTRDAADLLGVSLRTVQLWAEAGVLKAWKTAGGHRRIARTSVEDVLRQRRDALRSTRRTGRFSVLVVEDEPDFRRLYEIHLHQWNLPLDFEVVSGGFEALMSLGSSPPDLLITDLRMPGVDGFEMIRALRAAEPLRNLGIIVVTALSASTISERGGLPADITVLSKPLRFDDLRQLVAARLEAREDPIATP
jgi:excisionase family DNA binding protein